MRWKNKSICEILNSNKSCKFPGRVRYWLEGGNFIILSGTIYKIEEEFRINHCMTLTRERLNVDINSHTTMLKGGRGWRLLQKFYDNYK